MKSVKKRMATVLLILGTLLSFAMHKYYVSITEMEFNPENQKMEVSIKFIGHDLEHALAKAGVRDLRLGTDKEDTNANEYLHKYINRRFSVHNNGTRLPFTFVGKEIGNDDFIYCYLESSSLEDKPGVLLIDNSLLTEVFDKQANIMYYKIGDQKYNYRFTPQKTSIKQQ